MYKGIISLEEDIVHLFKNIYTSLCHDVSIDKICAYFKSIGWAEKCMRGANGLTDEHKAFFTMRLCNIIFDEYRERIYSARATDIKSVYAASKYVNGINDYIDIIYKEMHDWYKRAYLWSFMHEKILLPKLLYYYTKMKNG